MPGNQPIRPNYEYAYDLMCGWNDNLRALSSELKDRPALIDYAREPEGLQAASERAFVLACYGLTYLPRLPAPKEGSLTDKFSNVLGKPFDAWRTSVHRNRGQDKFTAFEDNLVTALKAAGEASVLAAFPGHVKDAQMLKATWDHISYKQQRLTAAAMRNLLDTLVSVAPATRPKRTFGPG